MVLCSHPCNDCSPDARQHDIWRVGCEGKAAKRLLVGVLSRAAGVASVPDLQFLEGSCSASIARGQPGHASGRHLPVLVRQIPKLLRPRKPILTPAVVLHADCSPF